MSSTIRRKIPTVNAGSMADIAFLLLIFFLVATTIAQDKGIEVTLPPYYEGEPGSVADRNVLNILVNAENEVLVEGKRSDITLLLNDLKTFVINPEKRTDLPAHPSKAIISIQHHESTSYGAYTDVYSIVKQAYIDLREDKALATYGEAFDLCSVAQRNEIRRQLPLRISEAEPFSH